MIGNGYLRSLIVVGATAKICYARETSAVNARLINAVLDGGGCRTKKTANMMAVIPMFN